MRFMAFHEEAAGGQSGNHCRNGQAREKSSDKIWF